MAVDPTAFYVSQTAIDSKIATLISGIHTKIDSSVLLLVEDGTTGHISVDSSSSVEFHKELKEIEKDFKWYKDLSNAGETWRLIGAYADDYSYSNKEVYVLDKVSISN